MLGRRCGLEHYINRSKDFSIQALNIKKSEGLINRPLKILMVMKLLYGNRIQSCVTFPQ